MYLYFYELGVVVSNTPELRVLPVAELTAANAADYNQWHCEEQVDDFWHVRTYNIMWYEPAGMPSQKMYLTVDYYKNKYDDQDEENENWFLFTKEIHDSFQFNIINTCSGTCFETEFDKLSYSCFTFLLCINIKNKKLELTHIRRNYMTDTEKVILTNDLSLSPYLK
jgi:hypothetical protein